MREWLIEFRKTMNLTQKQVAEKCNITRQMVSAIENGEATPSVTVSKALAKTLNFNWTRFFDTED